MLHEADIMTILLIFDSNLLEEVLDGHEDDAMFVCLLQPLLSFFLVANQQSCLISLNFLQLLLLISDLISVVERLQASLFLENLHLLHKSIHSTSTFRMTFGQFLVLSREDLEASLDISDISELIVVLSLDVFQEVFEGR